MQRLSQRIDQSSGQINEIEDSVGILLPALDHREADDESNERTSQGAWK